MNVNIDFKDMTKSDMLKKFVEMGGNLEEAWTQSFSCYDPTPDGKPCMQCKPCFRKFVAFAENGFIDKTWISTVIPYIEKEILPQIEAGTYGRGEKEEKAILHIYFKYKDVCK